MFRGSHRANKKLNVWHVFYQDVSSDRWNITFNTHSDDSDNSGDSSDKDEESNEDETLFRYKDSIDKSRELYRLCQLLEKFETYVNQCVILSFNSGKYDLSLVKTKLTKYLNLHRDKKTFVIEKGNEYLCMLNTEFRFMDITNILAHGRAGRTVNSRKLMGPKQVKDFFRTGSQTVMTN